MADDLYDEIMKRRNDEAASKAEAARLEISPANRLLPGREEQMRQARQTKSSTERADTSDTKAEEATRQTLQPAGLQQGPSIGPGNFYNSRAWKPEAAKEPPAPAGTSEKESLIEIAEQRAQEMREGQLRQAQQQQRPVARLQQELTR